MSKLTPGKEFELKFWCLTDLLPKALLRATEATSIVQGYLGIEPTVRVRLKDGRKAVMELKGPDDTESEPQELDLAFAKDALARFRVGSLIEKRRFTIPAPFAGREWEIDFFAGENAPLALVEIELGSKHEKLDASKFPAWLGDAITGDPKFDAPLKNKNLALRPFKTWPARLRKLAERHMRERLR